MNYRMIKYVIGWILIFEAIFLAVPLITAIIYKEATLLAIIATIAICLLTGLVFTASKPSNKVLYSREGHIIVALSWIVLSLFGALPFYVSGEIPSFVDALFETVSGFSTTGATILSDVEALPNSLLIWRCFTNWVGGMGVLVFIMAFVSLSGGQNMHIMKAESPGPSVSKLVPGVKTTALVLYSIYFVMTIIEFVFLIAGGMPLFDSVCTAISTAGTGGFGIKNDGFAGYSTYIQIVVTVFMLLFSVNFSSYYYFLTRKFREGFNSELRMFIFVVAAAVLVISLNIRSMFGSMGEAVRHTAFTVAGIISTTGFTSTDFNLWPELSRTVIVLLMFFGGCAGSTAGGIKLSRIIILFKSLGKELEVMIHPKQVKKITVDNRQIGHDVVRSVNVYMVSYVFIFVISLILVSFDNHDLITNFTSVASALNNIGPGLELAGPVENFGFFSAPTKLVLIFDMLAGRLELFPMLILFNRATWKK